MDIEFAATRYVQFKYTVEQDSFSQVESSPVCYPRFLFVLSSLVSTSLVPVHQEYATDPGSESTYRYPK